ncbi:hypothetical protein TH25_19185 [Thalassospira profundimaris]|uniref:Uncharacterized protein n=1 Tax=Thalassospira profundimaris TaxID=502049 RepID=A0A367WTS7_9PROT|nr:hypothetical protein TH25_19185 [Thalassospira profundimaris]
MRRANVFTTQRGRQSWDRAMSLISQTKPVKKSYVLYVLLSAVFFLAIFTWVAMANPGLF